MTCTWLGTKRMPMDKLSRDRVVRRTDVDEAAECKAGHPADER